MSTESNILKIVAVVAGLIALRFLIQRLRFTGPVGGTLGALGRFAMPPLLTGGPMFIALPATFAVLRAAPDTPVLAFMALGGGLGLTLGLAALFVMLSGQRREIDELRQQLAASRPA